MSGVINTYKPSAERLESIVNALLDEVLEGLLPEYVSETLDSILCREEREYFKVTNEDLRI